MIPVDEKINLYLYKYIREYVQKQQVRLPDGSMIDIKNGLTSFSVFRNLMWDYTSSIKRISK